MPKRKAPKERAVNALWVKELTRNRVFALREVGDTPEIVISRLLDCWDKYHGDDGDNESTNKD